MAQTSQKSQVKSQKNSSSKSEPQTMAELLKQTGYLAQGLKRGQQITGTISSITSKEILVDIAYKTEALVLERDKKLLKELLTRLSLGQKVNAVVVSPEGEFGRPLVSLRRELMDKNWEDLQKAKEEGREMDVFGVSVSRGGLIIDIMGLRGFIPLSHLATLNPNELVDTHFTARILDLDRSKQKIVLTQKGSGLSSQELANILKKMKIGEELKGSVASIAPFGIFVRLKVEDKDLEGLAHISELSWEKIEDISSLFKIGDSVNVVVIGKDPENLKLSLSIKQLTQDPWEEIAKKLTTDQQVRGIVKKVASFGVVVALEGSGPEGIIHANKIPIGQDIKVGEKITCTVETIEREKHRINLVPVLKVKPVGYR